MPLAEVQSPAPAGSGIPWEPWEHVAEGEREEECSRKQIREALENGALVLLWPGELRCLVEV